MTKKKTTKTNTPKKLYRANKKESMIGGVCAGIANYTNTDPTIIRLITAAIIVFSMGWGILAYILAWIIIPTKK
jgi:phage shock protein C